MPIYEYKCRECGQKFEKLRTMKEADLEISCQQCSSLDTFRVPSACFSKVDRTIGQSSSSSCSRCNGGSCASCGH